MKNFYMTLLSNSSMDYFPLNKTSLFTVQLPRYMHLDGNWEVALTEIQYPYTFSNVEDGQTEIQLETIEITEAFIDWWDKNERTSPPFEAIWSSHDIIPGFYTKINDIIDTVNETIAKETQQPTFFDYHPRAHRITVMNDIIQVGRKFIKTCKLSPRLALQLGFPPGEPIQGIGHYAQHAVNAGVIIPDKMLIYCDILEPQLFGDSWARILRMINTNAGNNLPYFGQPFSVTFNQPQYTPVQQKHFEAVSIDIKDIEGKLMAFQYGTLSVKLHFRRNKEF